MTSIFRNYFAGDHDNRRKRADARRGKLEEAEKFKDDDVNLSQIVRVGVLEQFFRALRELRDRVVMFLDLLENDVSLLKSRFGPQLVVGFDCRRQLVQSLLYPMLIIWLPITAVMVIRGDLKNDFETRLYDVLRDPPPLLTPLFLSTPPTEIQLPRCGSRRSTQLQRRRCLSLAWLSVSCQCSSGSRV